MLYPVELRAPEEQLICGGRARRSNSARKPKKFPAACKIRNDLLKQGYGAARNRPPYNPPACVAVRSVAGRNRPERSLPSVHYQPIKPTSVHSRNSTTGEEL